MPSMTKGWDTYLPISMKPSHNQGLYKPDSTLSLLVLPKRIGKDEVLWF